MRCWVAKVSQRISPRVSLVAVHHQWKQSGRRSRPTDPVQGSSCRPSRLPRRGPAAATADAGDARSSKSVRSSSSAAGDADHRPTVTDGTTSDAATRKKTVIPRVCLNKGDHFYFHHNFGKSAPIFIFFTVKFRKDLRRKLELKLPPPLKSVAALGSTLRKESVQLYIFAFMLATITFHVKRHLFMSFYSLLFFSSLTQSFQLWNLTFGTALNDAQLTHRPVVCSIQNMHVSKADILNTYSKLICVDKQRNSSSCEHWL